MLPATFGSLSDAATKGLDNAAGFAIVALFLLTAAPALFLSVGQLAPRLALALAIAFPATFVVLLGVIVATLP
jgi:hypothetical protein